MSPPRFGLGAFAWALVQPLRGAWWQLREPQLRALAVAPALVTLLVGAVLSAGAVLAAVQLQPQPFGRVVLAVIGVALALLFTVQLSGAISSAALERMSIYVQKKTTGEAPEPTLGVGRVLASAARSVLPTLRSLVLWALCSAAAAGLVLVPPFGPVLVVPVQVLLGAGFLAHGAVAASRERLELPRRLYWREPACLLGLTLGFVPFLLVPPLLIVGAGTIAISGTLVALGIRARRGPTSLPSSGAR